MSGSAATLAGSTRENTRTFISPTSNSSSIVRTWKIRRSWWCDGDLDRFEVHTNFTGTAKQVYRFSLDDLLKNQATAECKLPPIEVLRAVFTDPARLRPDRSMADVTEMAATEFATLADSLRARGVDPQRAAHFLMRLLFCLFAEDIGLLPPKLFSVLLERTRHRPADFKTRLGPTVRSDGYRRGVRCRRHRALQW